MFWCICDLLCYLVCFVIAFAWIVVVYCDFGFVLSFGWFVF